MDTNNIKKVDKATVIHIQNKMHKVDDSELSGRELLALAGKSSDKYDLFLEKGNSQDPIKPDQRVPLKNGMHFILILKDIKFG